MTEHHEHPHQQHHDHPHQQHHDHRLTWRQLVPETAESVEWSHSGIAVTDDGEVVFADPAGGRLVLFRIDDEATRYIDVPLLEIHGITVSRSADGQRLWLADPGFKSRPARGYGEEFRPGSAGRLDLETGDFTALAPPNIPAYTEVSWQPTSIAVARRPLDAEVVAVADGYGASLVHLYENEVYRASIDGSASGMPFACPHGVSIDDRGAVPMLVVADRGNRRIAFFTLDGVFVREIVHPLITSPSSLALRGDDLLVTELDGALLAVDADDEVRGLIVTREAHSRDGWPNARVDGALRRPELGTEALNSPHGLAVSPDGRIYLTEWMIGGRQLELTLS